MKRNVFKKSMAALLGLTLTIPQMFTPIMAEDLPEEPTESAAEETVDGALYLTLNEGGSAMLELKDGTKLQFARQHDGSIQRTKGKKTKILEAEHDRVLAYEGNIGDEITVSQLADEKHTADVMKLKTGEETLELRDDPAKVQITSEEQTLVVSFKENKTETDEDSEESSGKTEEEADEDDDPDLSKESKETAESDPSEESSEEKPTEESSDEEEQPEPDFSEFPEDTSLTESDLEQYDFSSKRLLVAGGRDLIIDPSHVLSEYDGVYLLQYETKKQARNAYAYYFDKADFVDIDMVLEIAEGDAGANGKEAMTEDANPLSELNEAVEQNSKKVKGTVIALIDTGVNDMTNVAEAVSMIGDDPADDNGHGTRMAQILREINPDVKILSIKALGANGTGDASAVYAAIAYAMERGVSIINLSISAAKKAESASIETIINEAVSRGITVVGAAGNKGKNAAYYIPGSIESAYIIGACDENGQRIGISNYGDTVDFNAVAGSTSEAAATFSAILSKSGKAVADEQIIFPTNYEPKEDEPEPGEEEDGDFHVSIGPNQDPTMGRANTPTGTQTLAEYLGLNTDNFRNNLMSHNSDHYYITTPYGGSYGEPDSMTNANGASGNGIDSRWAAGMNCAGWVARAIIDGGVSKATLRGMCEWVQNNTTYQGITSAGSHGGSYANASFYNWFATNYAKNGGTPIEHYWYETKAKMLAGQSGGFSYGGTSVPSATYVPKKGDIIFCEIDRQNMDGGSGNAWGWSPQDGHVDDYGNSIDVHIGIYWGDTAGEDRWWQSAHGSGSGPAKYTTYSGNSQGNVLSTIAPKSQSIFLVIPMGMPDSPDTAFLTVHKDSSNPDVTEGNTKYNMAGIQYTAYTNSGCTTVAKDINGTNAVFTLKKNGDAKETYEFEVDEAGKKMWIKETYVPEDSGYVMNDTKYTTTLKPQDSADEKVTVAVKDAGDTEKVRVKKVSSDTAITSGNNSYDMAGIVYRVYTDADCTARAKDVNGKNITLTLDAKGVSDEAEMAYGTYWMKEYSVSAATGYKLSSTAKKFTLDASSPAVTTVEMSDPPVTDTAGIVINKVDEKGNVYDGYNMAGAEYTVKFYAGQYTKSNLPGSASATWVIKTVKSGDAYKATLNDTCIVSGTAKYGKADDGSYIIPLGTLTIQETKAPAGFKIEGSTLQLEDGNGSDATDGVILLNLVDKDGAAIVKSGNQADNTKKGVRIQSKEIQIRGGVKIKKINKATGKIDTRTVGTVLTVYANGTIADAKYGRTYSKDDVIKNKSGNDLTITIGNDGIGQTAADALPPGSYYLKETTIAGPFKTNTQKITFTIGGAEADDGKIVDATGTPFENEPVRGGVKFAKVDADTGKAVAQGDGSLADYEITIYADEAITDVENNKSYAKNDAVMTIRGKEDGIAATGARDLAPGKYYAKETKAPAGYKINTSWKVSFTISEKAEDDGKIVDKTAAGDKLAESDIPGKAKVVKKDSDTGNAAQGDASPAGIRIAIVNRSANPVVVNGSERAKGRIVEVLTLNDNGEATSSDLPYGTYQLYELRSDASLAVGDDYDSSSAKHGASIYANGKGYLFNADNNVAAKNTVTIRKDGEVKTINFSDPIVKGGVKVEKWDKELNKKVAQGDADFSGIQFEITNKSAAPVIVKGTTYAKGAVIANSKLTANAAGDASLDAVLPYGTYSIREVATNGKYLLTDGSEYTFQIRTNGTIVGKDSDGKDIVYKDNVIRGDVRIEKWDKELKRKEAQGDADFAGIRLEIKNASKNPVVVNGKTYAVGETVVSLTTNAAGDAATTGKLLPYGTYTISEVKTNNSYLLTDGTARTFVIRKDGEVVTTSTDQNSLHFDNTPVKGGISVQKDDKERASGETQGDADLSGIRFAIVNDSEKLVKVSGRELDPGLVVAIIATDAKGKAETAKDLLPYGTYHVYELRQDAAIEIGDPYEGSDKLGSSIYANKSYLFAANEFEVKVTENNKIYLVNFQNDAVHGGVKVGKIDRETNQNVPQGLATLKDAEFTIYNSSKEPVVVGGIEYKTGEAIRSFISDENGIFETAADLLPYGTYTVKETKAPIGYLLNEDWQVTFQIREEGVIVDTMTEEGKTEDPDTSGWLEVKAGSGTNPAEVPDDIIRGDITFKKVDIDGYPMAGIPFVIQRLDADGKVVESHVIVSDEDGLVSTKSRKKTDDKVNSLDQYVKDGVFADDSKLDGSAGVWFGEQSARDDSRGALIYADYQIKELRCKANEGQDLLKTDEPIEIRENNVDVQLSNTLVDLNIRLESEAMDVTSDSKVVTYGTAVKLSDTVSYIHLKVYNEYELVTTFYNIRKDGEAVKLGEGSITFTPEKADNTKTAYGEITNIVTIDTTKAEPGTEVVAVDHLYKIEDGTKTEVASHNTDHTVESQKLFVPEMKTVASDSKTKDHVGTAEVEASISDILKYKNLADQKIYLVTAKLRDAETGEEVADPVTRLLRINYKDTEVTQKMLYWQGPKDGTMIMPAFIFDASAMEGKTLVVTETLTDMDSKEIILTHEALDDVDQQIHYIRVRTEAKDGITNTHVGTVTDKATVIDQVTIENAVIGETYVITGSLVYQEDCTDADGVFHKAGEVIAEHEPVEETAEETTIVKDLAFTLDASKLEGISGTVFEDVYHKNTLVGTHHDNHSEPQTIHWPKVRTTATDKETRTHTGVVGEKASIIDEVQLTNLVPGETYKVIGTLKTSEGEDFLVEGKPLTAEQEVIADKAEMTIPMEFTFDSSALKGRSLVVFEKLLYADAEVAHHEDKDDKGQTISYPDGKTNAADSSTKDQVGMVTETDTIIDTVSYHNLVVGETYTIKGQLMYKEPFIDFANRLHKAGEPVFDKEGKPVTAETTFEAKVKDGSVDLVYTLDSSLLKGATVVVFEDLYSNGAKVFSHGDLEDEAQSVWYPSVRTMAIDTVTEDHVGTTGTEAVIRDTVKLKNLKIGETYKVSGTLMDKDTGEALTDSNGANITAESEEFVAESRDMTILMEFYFDASIRENLSTVVFEELIHKDVVVAAHADINDEGQSVHHPAVHTTATDEETGEHVGRSRKKTVIHDTVKLYNLVPGMTYELEGYLVDSETGDPYLDADGNEVRVHTDPFKAERGKENTEMILTFTFNGSNLEGHSVTVFEDLYHNGHVVAAHRLKNDSDQMVDYPHIHTNAADQETGDHISRAGEKVTIIDEVTYTNLRPGLTYKVKGVLMNKETGKAFKVHGEKITAEKEFTPKKKDGSVKLEFTFDASALAGETVVVFEDVFYNEIDVAVHHDIEDEDQTVVVPKVRTSVKDKSDGDRKVKANTKVTLVDTVHMENLLTGRKYRVYGTLMNKKTGEVLMVNNKPITATSDIFTADNPEMDVDVTFELVLTEVEDTDLVVFEKLFMIDDKTLEEHEIGSHEDWDDKDQTICVEKNKEPKNPKTGDTTRVAVPILITAGSLAGLILTCIVKKKGRAKV